MGSWGTFGGLSWPSRDTSPAMEATPMMMKSSLQTYKRHLMHGAVGMHSPLSAASCCGHRGALSTWPRTHECTCNMACLRVTNTRHESNKVSITLVGISCAIGGCPLPSAGDNAQTLKHSFRWCELPCASTAAHTCAEAPHLLVDKATQFQTTYMPLPRGQC